MFLRILEIKTTIWVIQWKVSRFFLVCGSGCLSTFPITTGALCFALGFLVASWVRRRRGPATRKIGCFFVQQRWTFSEFHLFGDQFVEGGPPWFYVSLFDTYLILLIFDVIATSTLIFHLPMHMYIFQFRRIFTYAVKVPGVFLDLFQLCFFKPPTSIIGKLVII